MKNLIASVALFIFTIQSNADNSFVVLFPQVGISWENYLQQVKKRKAQTTVEYFLNNLQKDPSVRWINFLKKINLESIEFRKEFLTEIKTILENENLQFRDFEMILELTRQLSDYDEKNQSLKIFKHQIESLVNIIKEKSIEWPAENSYLVAGQPIDADQLSRIQKNLLPVKMTWLNYNSWPVDFSSLNHPPQELMYIISHCSTKILNNINVSYEILYKHDCEPPFSLQKSTQSISDFTKKNKSYLWLAAAALVVWQASEKYEIQIGF